MSDAKFNLISAYEFLKLLSENKLDLDVCDLSENALIKFNNLLIPTKHTSSSPSEVLFGTLVSSSILDKYVLPVVVKIFSDDLPGADNLTKLDIGGLKYEARVYKKIYETIIKNKISPNFISYVGYSCCSVDKIKKYFDNTYPTDKYETLYEFIKNNRESNVCTLITENANDVSHLGFRSPCIVYSLNESIHHLKQRANGMNRINDIMFQIIYSLSVMQYFEIMHNDLHTNNLLVRYLPATIKLGFTVVDKKFQLSTYIIPAFFDWDMAYMPSLGNNPKIETTYFDSLNMRNEYNPYTDLYILACIIYFYNKINISCLKSYMNDDMKRQEPEITGGATPKVIIEEKQLEQLSELPSFHTETISGVKRKIHRASREELIAIIGEEKLNELSPNIGSVLYYTARGSRNNYIVLYKNYKCRASIINTKFLTPLDILLTEFKQYEVDNFDSDVNFKYVFPMGPTKSSGTDEKTQLTQETPNANVINKSNPNNDELVTVPFAMKKSIGNKRKRNKIKQKLKY